MNSNLKRTIISLVIALSVQETSRGADFKDYAEQAWSIAVDPFKFGKLGESAVTSTQELRLAIREARDGITAIGTIQGELDSDIRYYLNDLDKKIVAIKTDSIEVISHATSEVTKLEKEIFNDITKLMRRAECTTSRVFQEGEDTLRETFSIFIKDEQTIQLPFGEERYWLFWTRPRTITIDLSQGLNPDKKFEIIEKAYLDNLNLANDSSPANEIVSVYGNLARLAYMTECHYKGQHLGEKLIRKYIKYNALVYPWNVAVKYGE